MVLYYLTLSTDAILIIAQQRVALLAFIGNELLSTNLTVSSVSVDLVIGSWFLIEEIVKGLLKLVISTDIYLFSRTLFDSWFAFWILQKAKQVHFKSWNISQVPGKEFQYVGINATSTNLLLHFHLHDAAEMTPDWMNLS